MFVIIIRDPFVIGCHGQDRLCCLQFSVLDMPTKWVIFINLELLVMDKYEARISTKSGKKFWCRKTDLHLFLSFGDGAKSGAFFKGSFHQSLNFRLVSFCLQLKKLLLFPSMDLNLIIEEYGSRDPPSLIVQKIKLASSRK